MSSRQITAKPPHKYGNSRIGEPPLYKTSLLCIFILTVSRDCASKKSRTARKPLAKDFQQFCLHDFYITSDTICPVLLPDISLTTLYELPGGIQPKGPALWAKPFSQFPVIICENTVLYQPFCLSQDRCSLKLSLVFLSRFTAALIAALRKYNGTPLKGNGCSAGRLSLPTILSCSRARSSFCLPRL